MIPRFKTEKAVVQLSTVECVTGFASDVPRLKRVGEGGDAVDFCNRQWRNSSCDALLLACPLTASVAVEKVSTSAPTQPRPAAYCLAVWDYVMRPPHVLRFSDFSVDSLSYIRPRLVLYVRDLLRMTSHRMHARASR